MISPIGNVWFDNSGNTSRYIFNNKKGTEFNVSTPHRTSVRWIHPVHIIVIIKTAWQILYFVLRNPFKTYAKIKTVHNRKSSYFIYAFSYFKFSRKQDTTYCLPLHWFILLCLYVILLYLNVNFIVWMCISYTYLLIVIYRVKTFWLTK